MICFVLAPLLIPQSSVHMAQHDTSRAAAFDAETVLKRSNVNSASFGTLFSRKVDASQYAQPLIAANLWMPASGVCRARRAGTQHPKIARWRTIPDGNAHAGNEPVPQVHHGRGSGGSCSFRTPDQRRRGNSDAAWGRPGGFNIPVIPDIPPQVTITSPLTPAVLELSYRRTWQQSEYIQVDLTLVDRTRNVTNRLTKLVDPTTGLIRVDPSDMPFALTCGSSANVTLIEGASIPIQVEARDDMAIARVRLFTSVSAPVRNDGTRKCP